MRLSSCTFLLLAAGGISFAAQSSGAHPAIESLLEVKRIYVGQLNGGAQSAGLRDLIIASLDGTKLFLLTDKEERADAILKGAGDDKTFVDTFDTYDGTTGHTAIGKSGSSISGVASKVGGVYGGNSIGENESQHYRERKHEAFATVRLVNKDGDVLWSTTQESLGAKFRGASADVAAKIARQIAADYERQRHAAEGPPPPAKP